MKVAVIPVTLSNTARVTNLTRDQITARFKAVDDYFRLQSGGRATVDYTVLDWFPLPMTLEVWRELGFNAGDHALLMYPGGPLLFSGFQHFVWIVDYEEANGAAWRQEDHRHLYMAAAHFTPALGAHELGHLAGAGHGFLRTPFRDLEYGDMFCIMGAEEKKFAFKDDQLGSSGPGMTASMLHACGWLNFGSSGVTVDLGLSNRNEASVQLAPLRGASGLIPVGLPLVAWSDGLAPSQRLELEYRVRDGLDKGFPTAGSAPGWIVAHLTGNHGAATDSVLIGAIGANPGAILELPEASLTMKVLSSSDNLATLKLSRRIRHLFGGSDGVLYAIGDTGDLFWYRHDGWGDGSFNWTDAFPRRIGSGWNFRHVFSGGHGVIYAVNQANELLWFRHDGSADGSFRWADTNPRTVGWGWNFRQIISGGDGVIYAVDDEDNLLWYRHEGQADGSVRWADSKARTVGSGWRFKQIFSDDDGIIYAINEDADLLWYRHEGRSDGRFRWTDSNPRKVGHGWNFRHVFSGGNGVIYAIDHNDDLQWYRHDGRRTGTFEWADDHAQRVGIGWHLRRKQDTPSEAIYAIGANKDLLWYLHDGKQEGTFRWRFDQARTVGYGWNFEHIFSANDSVIYAIDALGNLYWNRHDGQAYGSFDWQEGPKRDDRSPIPCGIGWNFKQVFSGDDGVIYAINANNELLWYQHEGRTDGTFRWTDNHARKVGTGWNFKQVFAGGDGIIYAINWKNELLWYRHDGRVDGRFRWTDNHARKVGTGWNFKQVFSGRDGVIYAINAANELLWYRHEGRADGRFRWTDNQGRKVGHAWAFGQIFGA